MKSTKSNVCLKKIVILFLIFISLVLNFGSVFAQSSEMTALQGATRSIAKAILPSVVTVDTRSTVKVPIRGFDFFFDPFGTKKDQKDDNNSQEYQQEGLGSGIIIRNDKNIYYVLTNAHVVEQADEINIITIDEEEFVAKVIGIDKGRDLALISFTSKKKFIIATLGDSDTLQQGDIVFAVGNPYGFRSSITFGIVSAVNREANVNQGLTLTNYIQTDAAVNKGNSGGPLVNIKGEVVGINTWIYSRGSEGNVGLSFAVPINNAKNSIVAFIEKREINYGWLGTQITKIYKKEMNSLKTTEGILISGVYDMSPADRGGIKVGDIIQSVNGDKILSERDLINKIASMTPGEKTNFVILREGKKKTMSITLSKRNEDDISKDNLWPGFGAFDITESIKKRLEVSGKSGVIVTRISKGSAAGTAGIRTGDIIEKINNKKVKNLREFYSELNDIQKNEEAIFRLTRGKTSLVVGIVK